MARAEARELIAAGDEMSIQFALEILARGRPMLARDAERPSGIETYQGGKKRHEGIAARH